MISSNSYINIIFWIGYVIAIIIGIEIFTYIWHRYGAHSDYLPGIADTHQIHHMMDLDLLKDAKHLSPGQPSVVIVNGTQSHQSDEDIYNISNDAKHLPPGQPSVVVVNGTESQQSDEDIYNISNDADEDFIWIMLMMILFELIMGIGVIIEFIPGVLAIVTIVVSLIVFWWNWRIHKAYHNPDHWLNSYEWFRIEKDRHYIHHYHSDRNYGIASHFSDKIMGTWLDPTTR